MAERRKLDDGKNISDVIKKFADVTNDHFGGYGYAVGYLQSVFDQHFTDMPLYVQESIIRSIESGTEKYSNIKGD